MSSQRNARLSRILVLLCLAMVVASGMPGSALLPRQAATVDIVVDPASIWVEPSHPEVGEMAKLSASVWNNAEYDTSVVDVLFWDGNPSLGHIIGSDQQSIDPGDTKPFSTTWNTSSLRSGFHEIWVTANPTDFADTNMGNNNASRELVLTGQFSWIVDTAEETFSGPKIFSDIMGIWNVGRLTLENATIYIPQERDYQFGIIINDQGRLTLRTTTIGSDHALSILVEGAGQLVVEPGCTISANIITRDRAFVSMDNSTLSGGMDIRGGNVSLTNSILEGVFSFQSTIAVFQSDTFTTNETISFSSSRVTADDTAFELLGGAAQSGADTLNVTAGTTLKLTDVVSGTIAVQGIDSMVLVYRYLTMHAEDNTGLAVPYGNLWLRNLFNWEPPQCRTTDKLGDARFTVITDVLLPGAGGTDAKPVGSYNVTGVLGNVQAQTNIQLPYYPTMSAESNWVARTIVFEPIFYQTGRNPKDIVGPTVMGDKDSIGDFSWNGDVYVRANFTLYNIPLYIDQRSDFWAGVYIYPTGRLNFVGGGITSNHRLNVYIIGGGQMTIEPTSVMSGMLNINSLVGLADENGAKGRFSARNIEFNGSVMGTYDDLRFSVSNILPHPSNTINGALAFSVETADIGNTTVTAPPPGKTASRVNVGQSLKFTSCDLNIPRFATGGNVVSFSQCALSGRYALGAGTSNAGSLLNLSATTLSIIECTMDYEEMVLGAQSFISTSTDYPIPLIFEGTSTGSLTDVIAPAIVVNDSAEVEVKWLFSLSVMDAFGTPVDGAEVSVRNYTTNVTIGGGQQTTGATGKVVFLLLGKRVYADEEFFLGNYKVMVSKKTSTGATAEYGPYDISMRGNVDLSVRMDSFMNPLERLRVQIDNLSRYSNLSENDEVSCYGHVWKLYRGGHIEAAGNFPVTLTLSNSGTQYNGTTDGNGFFNLTFRAPPASERNITVTVLAAEAGADPGTDSVFNLSVPLPRPDALRINFQGFDRLDRKYTRNKDTVTVYGNVEFLRKGKSIGVASNASVRITVNPGNRDFYTTTDATGIFRVSLGKYSTVSTYFLTVSAVYTQGNLSVSAPVQSAQFNVKKEATGPAAAAIPIWIIALVIVLVVGVVGVAAFFVMRMQAEAAKLVECGECGAFIPESALKCPKCGTEFETEVVKCSECGSWIPPNVTECPKCNAQFKRRVAAAKGQPPKPGAPGAPGKPGEKAPAATATTAAPTAPPK
jgi:hypothetical protein